MKTSSFVSLANTNSHSCKKQRLDKQMDKWSLFHLIIFFSNKIPHKTTNKSLSV